MVASSPKSREASGGSSGKPTAAKSMPVPPKPKASKLDTLLMKDTCAVILRSEEARSLCNLETCQDPDMKHFVFMPFQCRTLTIGHEIFVAVHHDEPDFAGNCTAGVDGDHVYKVIGKFRFISNRRFDTEKLLAVGASSPCGLPADQQHFTNLKADLGIKKENKTHVVWELQWVCTYQTPVCISSATPVLESNASAPASYSSVRPRVQD